MSGVHDARRVASRPQAGEHVMCLERGLLADLPPSARPLPGASMPRSRLAAAVTLVVLGWTAPAHATRYFVDQSSGNDANTGVTASSAWKTIAKANATLRAGDVVVVQPGVYA